MQPNPPRNPEKPSWLEITLLLAPFLFLAALWDEFPAVVPIHWNIHGRIDGWASKSFALFLLPVSNLVVFAFFLLVPRLDSRMRNPEGQYGYTPEILRIVRMAGLALMLGIFAIQSAVALGFKVSMDRCVVNGTLLFLLLTGNYFSNIRPNFVAGIRTPWTLKNPNTWRATHRIGARIMVFGSLLILIAQAFIPQPALLPLFVVFVLGFAAWGFIYSWNHSRVHARSH